MIEKDRYQVPCIAGGVKNAELQVAVPGSKSITNRALLLATLAQGTSTLRGVLFSQDSRYFLSSIQSLGFETQVNETEKIIQVTGLGGAVPKTEASIYVGSAGTAARFLSAYLGVSKGSYELDASEQMRRRPMAPLLQCLEELGCKVTCHQQQEHFPFCLEGSGFSQNTISVDIENSSQFLSGLLISAGLAKEDIKIQVTGSHGMAYVTMTQKMMQQFGVQATETENSYLVPAGQQYHALDYQIEPDVSAACYFYAMAPLLGITVTVEQVFFDSLQGDVEFVRILERMGCQVTETPQGIQVRGSREGYHGVQADMSMCSDQAITLAALAPFAKEPTTIYGIGHIRFQESNRIAAIVTELEKMGIRCESSEDSITIYPGMPQKSLVETYEDHRMAMGFSLIGLRAEGITIDNPACCKKTFEDYFQVLEGVIDTLTQ